MSRIIRSLVAVAALVVAGACGSDGTMSDPNPIAGPSGALSAAEIDAFRACSADSDCVSIGISCTECAYAAVNRAHTQEILDRLDCAATGGNVQCVGATFQPVCRDGMCE